MMANRNGLFSILFYTNLLAFTSVDFDDRLNRFKHSERKNVLLVINLTLCAFINGCYWYYCYATIEATFEFYGHILALTIMLDTQLSLSFLYAAYVSNYLYSEKLVEILNSIHSAQSITSTVLNQDAQNKRIV